MIAYVQARAGFAADAIQTAGTIVEPRRKNSALGLIAMAMARRGEFRPASELADKIGDEKTKQEALQEIAEARAEAGDVQGAMAWARSRTTPECAGECPAGHRAGDRQGAGGDRLTTRAMAVVSTERDRKTVAPPNPP